MKFFVVTIEPVQEIAAEQGTLDQLAATLRATYPERSATSPLGQLGSLLDVPLVADPALIPGVVHLRPFPRPADTAEFESAPPGRDHDRPA